MINQWGMLLKSVILSVIDQRQVAVQTGNGHHGCLPFRVVYYSGGPALFA